MQLPFFYITDYNPGEKEIRLDEENSRHAIAVLRMKKGEQIKLTDGKGKLITARITEDHKKNCMVRVEGTETQPAPLRTTTIAISLLKNTGRFEWFLEKATELGVSEIIPMVCERTEKQKLRTERMQQIIVSAMLQSQQWWKPQFYPVTSFKQLVSSAHHHQRFIAHCMPEQKRNLADLVNESLPSQIILIGPEGDFTATEIEMALTHHFDAVNLGETRLRSETAAMVAATLLKLS